VVRAYASFFVCFFFRCLFFVFVSSDTVFVVCISKKHYIVIEMCIMICVCVCVCFLFFVSLFGFVSLETLLFCYYFFVAVIIVTFEIFFFTLCVLLEREKGKKTSRLHTVLRFVLSVFSYKTL
jgi:hypothetical protein